MPNSHAPNGSRGSAESPAPDAAGVPSSDVDADVTADIEVSDKDLLLALTGPSATRVAALERHCDVSAGVRGNVIRLQGSQRDVREAERVLAELLRTVKNGTSLSEDDIASSIRVMRDHPDVELAQMLQPIAITAERGRQITPRGLAQKHYVQAIQTHDIVFGVGPAGTGKTYLAMAMAVAALTSQRVKRVVLTRPAVEAGEKLGFLPGDMAEKVDPYLRPLFDALHDMLPAQRAAGLIERGAIEVAPLAFMRGRTLSDSFIILDEAQNTSVAQMRMLLTRIGQRSKAVITGDATQVDLPRGMRSGLADAVDLLADVEGIARCRFTSADVVRHTLVQRIVDAYDARDARVAKAQHGGPQQQG